jgi:hypothetical protein
MCFSPLFEDLFCLAPCGRLAFLATVQPVLFYL